MHPLLVATLAVAVLPLGLAGPGGAVEAGGAEPAVAETTEGQFPQLDESNTTGDTAASHPTRTRSTGYMVGSFFIRFGPMLLVVGLLAWILLTRD